MGRTLSTLVALLLLVGLVFYIVAPELLPLGIGKLGRTPPPPPPPPPDYTKNSPGQVRDYSPPNLRAHLFTASNLSLKNGEAAELRKLLTGLVRNFYNHKRVTSEIKAKALALALRLDPEDKDASMANYFLSRGKAPTMVDYFQSLDEITPRFWEIGGTLGANRSNQDDVALAGLLLSIAAEIDPMNEDKIYAYEKFRKFNSVSWEDIITKKKKR